MRIETLQIDKKEKGIAWVYINNEPVNAIGEQLMEELELAVADFTNDPKVRVVVVTSKHPKNFLAGADLKGMFASGQSLSDEEDAIAKRSARMQQCFQQFATMPKPVIAAINGNALGGGCEFAMACDFRFMSKGLIGLTEVSLGLIPGAGGTQRMTKLLGRAKAIELIFTAKRLKAKEAEQIGLIHRAVSEEDLVNEVTAFAEQLSDGAVHAMGLAKRAINAAEGPLNKGLEIEAKAFQDTFSSDEPSIGLAAFFLKEKPNFRQ